MGENEIYNILKKEIYSGSQTLFIFEAIMDTYNVSENVAKRVAGRLNADIAFLSMKKLIDNYRTLPMRSTLKEDFPDIPDDIMNILIERIDMEAELKGMIEMQSARGNDTEMMESFFIEKYPNVDEAEAKLAATRYNVSIYKNLISYYASKDEWDGVDRIVDEAKKTFEPEFANEIFNKYFEEHEFASFKHAVVAPNFNIADINLLIPRNNRAYNTPAGYSIDLLESTCENLTNRFYTEYIAARYIEDMKSTTKPLSFEKCKRAYPNFPEKIIAAAVGRVNDEILFDTLRQSIYYGDKTKITDEFIRENYSDWNLGNISSITDRYNELINIGIERKYDVPSDNLRERLMLDKLNEQFVSNKCATSEMLKEMLESGIPDKVNQMQIYIRNASELSVRDVQALKKRGIKCNIIMSDIGLDSEQRNAYNEQSYIMCRQEIDEIVEQVEASVTDEENRALRKFEKVCEILSKRIKYDHAAASKEDAYRKVVYERYDDILINDNEDNKRKYGDAVKKYNELDFTTPRNMVGGLLNGECVCAGYAEILRNVLTCVGIESIYVGGFSHEDKGHAWNQVKIDGEWYNTDLTWMRDDIVNGKTVEILQNDLDFNMDQTSEDEIKPLTHGKYKRDCQEHECVAASIEYIPEAANPKSFSHSVRDFLNSASQKIGVTHVKKASDKLIDTIRRSRTKNVDRDNKDGERDDR